MTNKDFVLKKEPTAKVKKQTGVFAPFFTIYKNDNETIAVAYIEEIAWEKAVEVIAEKIVVRKSPKAELLQNNAGTNFVVYEAISCTVLAAASTPVAAWRKAAEAIENEPI